MTHQVRKLSPYRAQLIADARNPAARDVADMAWPDSGWHRNPTDDARPLPGQSDDVLAGGQARRQRQEQRPVADRAGIVAVVRDAGPSRARGPRQTLEVAFPLDRSPK